MIKQILLTLIVVAVLLIVPNVAKSDDGFAVWGLLESNVKDTQTAATGRVSYRIEDIEPFVGYTAWPDYEVDGLEVNPPDVLSLGSIVNFPDLLDPENPLPIIPNVLLTFLPENWVAFPYIGGQATWHMGRADGGFYGGIVGLKTMRRPEDQSALIIETAVNHGFEDLGPVVNDWEISAGVYIRF